MNATGIEYLNFTWSPLVGCSGLGCAAYDVCWAKYMKRRKLTSCQPCYEFQPHPHFERLQQIFKVKKPSRIGVCFSADMWDTGFTREQQSTVVNFCGEAKQHWFINLTKQPQNIPKDWEFPDNWVQGVSVNKLLDLERIEILKKTQTSLKAISFEPLYENLGWELTYSAVEGIDWFIIGAQTHPLFLPKEEWIQELVNLGFEQKIPVFIKNNIPTWNRKEFPESFLSGRKTNNE